MYTAVQANEDRVMMMVNASVVLHNFLMTVKDANYVPPGFCDQIQPDGSIADGYWRIEQRELGVIEPPRRSNWLASATWVRDRVVDWCAGVGARNWQNNHINRLSS